MTLRLRTFGAVYLERDRSPLGGAHTQRRRLALLAYLAASDRPVVTRHTLIALLWPESDEAGGRHSLSQLLYAIRHDLGAEAIGADQETIRLNRDIVGSDVHDFDTALALGQLERAAELYRGAFLDGFYVDDAAELNRWIDEERARRAGRYARALERLAADAALSQDNHGVVDWWRRRAALDPTDGRVALCLMRGLVAIGDRRGALQAARVYETMLREDLDAEPDRAVKQLVEELRRDSQPRAEFPAPESASVAVAPATLPVAPATLPVAPATLPVAPATLPAAPAILPVVGKAPSASPRVPTRRPVIVPLVLAAVAVFAIPLARQLWRTTSRDAVPPTAVVILGDLAGPDSVLALAVREALRAELSNTRGIQVTSDVSMRELKALMRLSADSTLRPQDMLTVATRGGAHIVITGSVVPIGAGAQIVLDALDPATGRAIRTFAERPLDPPAILRAVERIGRALGAAISRASLDSTVRALPAVTTGSLAALKSYALARQSAARGLRAEAVDYGERAVAHDSAFVLAHYLLGDLLWFLDQQAHSDAHLTKAYELRATVPSREQLMIRARYEQLVRDRPDSALLYWGLLGDASPGDALTHEGRAWALRALGRHEEAAAAADTAMRLDPAAVVPNTNNALYSWLAVGDTTRALALAASVASRNPEAPLEARFYAVLERGDLKGALALADSSTSISNRAWRRQLACLAAGDFVGARAALDSLRGEEKGQFVPRALLNEGWVELALRHDRTAARQYARETLAWLRQRDLSPPAVARLAERLGDLAARAGDEATVRAIMELVDQRDHGRGLRSYDMARRTLSATLAYVQGNFPLAATRAAEARHGVYFWRSLITIVQLEADARRAAGETAAASSLDQIITAHQIVDGDFDTWSVLRTARRRPAS